MLRPLSPARSRRPDRGESGESAFGTGSGGSGTDDGGRQGSDRHEGGQHDGGRYDGGRYDGGRYGSDDRHAGEPPADPEAVARSICLGQLDRAPRTRGQLADAMRRRLVPDDVAERVLTRLEQVGLVDDEAFARAWVQSRHGSKGLAGKALGRELRSRGVDDDTVSSAVGELDEETELETARSLATRRQRSMSALPAATQQRRLVSMLGRKGYPSGLVYRVVREVVGDAAREDQLSSDALQDD